jgi:hypothetical protein
MSITSGSYITDAARMIGIVSILSWDTTRAIDGTIESANRLRLRFADHMETVRSR